MRLDEIAKDDKYTTVTYQVYYAHKNRKQDGYLSFRKCDGSYPENWTPKEVEEHARKDWARKPHYGTGGPPRWDDQNYVFVVIKERMTMVHVRSIEGWKEHENE